MKSQMGMSFEPEQCDEESGYPETGYYWNSVRDMFERGSDNVKFLIEALWHQIAELEHNEVDTWGLRHDVAVSYALIVSDTVGSMVRAAEVEQLNKDLES
jgi:hypothetical protein